MSSEKDDVEEIKDEVEEVKEEVEEIKDEVEEIKETEEEVQKAKKYGHKSLEEHLAAGGTKETYKTEREFNLTGEVIELKKTLQKRDKDIEEIIKYERQVIENHKIKMKQELAARLQEARQNGDVDAVEKITQEKVRADIQEQQEAQTKQNEDARQLDQDFLTKNKSWYNTDHLELVDRSREIDARIRIQYPNLTYAQLLTEIEKQMKYELSRDDRYSHLVVDSDSMQRVNLSASKSNVTKSSTQPTDSNSALYAKLTSNQKHMYDILQRIEQKSLERNHSKEAPKLSVKKFLQDMKKDEEI